jgi:hypothetical protein
MLIMAFIKLMGWHIHPMVIDISQGWLYDLEKANWGFLELCLCQLWL